MRTRTVAVLYAIPVATAALGYAISTIVGAPSGADHSCPSSAPISACRYPPNTARWALEWTAGGLLVGVALTAIAWAILRRRRISRPASPVR
jgi:hypothetical protein